MAEDLYASSSVFCKELAKKLKKRCVIFLCKSNVVYLVHLPFTVLMVEIILFYLSLSQVYFLHYYSVELGRLSIFCLTFVIENQCIIAFWTEEIIHFPLVVSYLLRYFPIVFNGQWKHNAFAL